MGECSVYSSLYSRTQRSSLQLGLRVGGHLALTDFRPDEPKSELSHMASAVDDSTINVVVVIIILLLSLLTLDPVWAREL